MAKIEETDKLDVRLGKSDVSEDVRRALYTLENIHNEGMTLDKITELVELIKAECGSDAIFEISTSYTDYFGSETEHEIRWSRKETDEEVVKRIEKNKKRKKTAATTRKKTAAKKIVDEKAELVRLQAKYSDEI